MLPSRVAVPASPDPTQEDIFSSSMGILFSDDAQNFHGIPGQSVTYSSPRYGIVSLRIPRHPDADEGRKLFAHHLWNAGVVAADAIERASRDEVEPDEADKVRWNSKYWDIRDQNILELGAGTALPSIIAALCSAKSISITDHPSSPSLTADTIAHNVRDNLYINLLPHLPDSDLTHQPNPRTSTNISIHGLAWGDPSFTSPFHYGKLSHPQPPPTSFDKLIIADCLWMPAQHANIVTTIDQTLRRHNSAPTTHIPCALITAGFHTGRSIIARFFELATGSNCSKETTTQDSTLNASPPPKTTGHHFKAADIFEVDVNYAVRPWQAERPGETKEEAKRWVVCAVLVRNDEGERI